VFTSVQGLVTVMLKVPAGYTLDGNVQLKTPLSTRCSGRHRQRDGDGGR
jgi:hypothetical protein